MFSLEEQAPGVYFQIFQQIQPDVRVVVVGTTDPVHFKCKGEVG